jgi:glycosyltransferase involved in cell wall biosynthesis
MSTGPRVSVVIPVFNGAPYLQEAIESVLDQTYRNVEILVVNDGSTDGGVTSAIGMDFATRYPDHVRYVSQANKGVAGALNTGISAMTGEFFCWLSHDDLYLPEKIEVQLEFWRGLESETAIVFSDWSYIDPEGTLLRHVRLPREQVVRSPLSPVLAGGVNGCTILVPRKVMKDARFDERYRYVQDYRLWYDLARANGFFHLPLPLVRQRLHDAQDSHRPAALTEGEALWTDFLVETTEIERVQAAGSSLRFYAQMARQLAETPYVDSAALARELADQAVSTTKVSVILTGDVQGETARASVAGLRGQEHGHLEILAPTPQAAVFALDESNAAVRFVPSEAASAAGRALDGVRAATGSYVVFLPCGSSLPPSRIAMQLRAVMEEGAMLSQISRKSEATAMADRYLELHLEDTFDETSVMFHREAIFDDSIATRPGLDLAGVWLSLAQSHSILMLPTASVTRSSAAREGH